MSEQSRWALACRVADLEASGALPFSAERHFQDPGAFAKAGRKAARVLDDSTESGSA